MSSHGLGATLILASLSHILSSTHYYPCADCPCGFVKHCRKRPQIPCLALPWVTGRLYHEIIIRFRLQVRMKSDVYYHLDLLFVRSFVRSFVRLLFVSRAKQSQDIIVHARPPESAITACAFTLHPHLWQTKQNMLHHALAAHREGGPPIRSGGNKCPLHLHTRLHCCPVYC